MKAQRTTLESIPPLLVTREEAQHFLRYGKTEIDKLLQNKQLEVIGHGQSLRIVYDSMVRFVEQNKRLPT